MDLFWDQFSDPLKNWSWVLKKFRWTSGSSKKLETVLNHTDCRCQRKMGLKAMVLRAHKGLGARFVGLVVAAASVDTLAPPGLLFRALGPSAISPKRVTSLVFGSTLDLTCDRHLVSAVCGHADEGMGREGDGTCNGTEAKRAANLQALENQYAGQDWVVPDRDGLTESSIGQTVGRTLLEREHLSSLKRTQLQESTVDTVFCNSCHPIPLHLLTSPRCVLTFDR